MSRLQLLGMPGDMLTHEGGDEIVAVVIAGAQVQRQRLTDLLAHVAQDSGPQLFLQEFVIRALIDEQMPRTRAVRDQRAGVIRPPALLVLAKVERQRRLPPKARRAATRWAKRRRCCGNAPHSAGRS